MIVQLLLFYFLYLNYYTAKYLTTFEYIYTCTIQKVFRINLGSFDVCVTVHHQYNYVNN